MILKRFPIDFIGAMATSFVIPQVITDHRIHEEKHRDIRKVNQYALLETIGHSTHTKVYLALDVENNAPYAAKAIAIGGLHNTGLLLEREIRLLRRFNHPNIVKLREVLHAKRLGVVYLILEWASCGSLAQALKLGLAECVVAGIFKQVCCALAALHADGVVHHDIKPSNILLFAEGVAKLSDFGIGHSIASADTVLGTPAYQAPEFFDESTDIVLDPVKEDVWSLGVSIYEAAFGRLPFTGANMFEISWNVLHNPLVIPESASDALRELLHGMLEPNPAKRMPLQEVVQHRFFHHSQTAFVLPVRTPPKLNPGRAMSYVVANVCDEEYTFVKRQLSASSPVSLYGFF